MSIVVMYESMFGNTRAIAEAVTHGAQTVMTATLTAIHAVDPAQVESADLVIVGSPTHAWSISSTASRRTAADQASRVGSRLHLEADALEPGVREWLDSRPILPRHLAVFDTRVKLPALFTGRASRTIRQRLARAGATIEATESFLVTKDNVLVPGELQRARDWGRSVALALAPVMFPPTRDEIDI